MGNVNANKDIILFLASVYRLVIQIMLSQVVILEIYFKKENVFLALMVV